MAAFCTNQRKEIGRETGYNILQYVYFDVPDFIPNNFFEVLQCGGGLYEKLYP